MGAVTGPGDEQLRRAADRLVAQVAADPRCSRVTDVLVARRGSTLVHAHPGAVAPHDLFSVTKTVLALLTGLAVGDGALRTDTALDHLLPELSGPGVAGRTPEHLLTLQRGPGRASATTTAPASCSPRCSTG